MLDRLTNFIHSWGFTWGQVLFAVGFSVVTFVGSLGVATVVLVKLPANYFHSSHARDFLVERHPVLRMVGIFVKNLFGLVLVFFGVLMSLPGVPGQGVLTILLGVMLLDFPGKRRVELKLIRRPKVLRAINRIRRKFDRPPLQLDEA